MSTAIRPSEHPGRLLQRLTRGIDGTPDTEISLASGMPPSLRHHGNDRGIGTMIARGFSKRVPA
ncbi:hypothetical protein LI99_16705 [Mycolicibacterium smegmatis]|nr:hypothetical protein LJ00_16700 [Mycolicibacterium smegmatis MC2 155]AIU15125.1 hypothetical protein LI99_16705 [Mycolicibacterium smegmatis]AIU21748.1 hypothetical protein LI98_16710 [Mycolicibacterium smegmatis]